MYFQDSAIQQREAINVETDNRWTDGTLYRGHITGLCPVPGHDGYAQQLPSEADFKAFNDRRIEIVKFALQLTPAQEKYWPAVEAAIRSRGEMRRARLARLASLVNDQRERSVIELLRERADGLTQRGESLKKLVDAWQPLYESLDERQKMRLRFLAVVVLREIRDAVESRMMQTDEDDDFPGGPTIGHR